MKGNCVISELCHTPLFSCHNSYICWNTGIKTRVYDEMPQFERYAEKSQNPPVIIMSRANDTIQHNSRSTSKGGAA